MKRLLSVLLVTLMCVQMSACSSAPADCTHDFSQYISKQEYDALMEKYETAQSELNSAKAQYEEAKSAYEAIAADQESTVAERDAALANYETAKAEFETLNANFETLQATYNALKEYVDENMDPLPTTPPAGSFNPDEVLKQLEIKEYIYEDNWFPKGFLSIKNNSAYNIRVSASVKLYDAAGNLIGVQSDDVVAFEAGTETLLAFYADEKFASMTYELTIEQEDYYGCVVSNLTYETISAKNKEIVSVTNNGKKAADFVEGYMLFFKNGSVVGFATTYFVDDDSELKAGKTISKEMDCYEEYDSFLLFFRGRSS